MGMSFASLLVFWTVASSRNLSLAPFGPLNVRRPSLRMRLRGANSISTCLRFLRAMSRAPSWMERRSLTASGLLDNPALTDKALAGKFKVPTLRNAAVTDP